MAQVPDQRGTPPPGPAVPPPGPMVVCGDDALAHRLAVELSQLYEQRVRVVVPSLQEGHGPQLAALAARPGSLVEVREAAEADEAALRAAGVGEAAAVALTYADDQANIHAALRARRIDPRARLVVRLFNRTLGRHLESVLLAGAGDGSAASTTVLSDADTAAPALVAAALADHRSRVVQADGLLLRAAERPAGDDGGPGLCTLALIPDGPGEPAMLPPDGAAGGHTRVVLETVTRGGAHPPARRRVRALPVRELLSRRLLRVAAVLGAIQLVLAVLMWASTGGPPLRAAYLSLLDLMSMGDPALGEPTSRQVLQLLSGLIGMALLPVLFAIALQAIGAFRTAASLRPPSRGQAGHVVLVGLGRIGTRVLDRLHDVGADLVCVERDPRARGVALARQLRVPVVIGDATQEGVLEAAGAGRATALLALTSDDGTNLETALLGRLIGPDLRVVMRLFDDEFARAVNHALRVSYPGATTRSRSVSTLAAPAFAGAMMGRQILGALPVGRHVLVFAALDVRDHPALAGRTVAEAFRPGAWRVLALDLAEPGERRADLANDHPGLALREPELAWNVHAGYVLGPTDRVVLATTRRGLAELHRHRRSAPGPPVA